MQHGQAEKKSIPMFREMTVSWEVSLLLGDRAVRVNISLMFHNSDGMTPLSSCGTRRFNIICSSGCQCKCSQSWGLAVFSDRNLAHYSQANYLPSEGSTCRACAVLVREPPSNFGSDRSPRPGLLGSRLRLNRGSQGTKLLFHSKRSRKSKKNKKSSPIVDCRVANLQAFGRTLSSATSPLC